MKLVKGSGKVPVIYTAHHASHDFHKFDSRVALSEEQKIRFSDYGTDLTVPTNGLASIIAEHSRALGDLNRDPNDPGRFQTQDYGQPIRHDIWRAGKELTEAEKTDCQTTFHQPFHDEIISQLTARRGPTFVVAWDNTAHYRIGDYLTGKHEMMRPFILSNRGSEESGEAGSNEPVSCDPALLELLAEKFRVELRQRGLPDEVHLNFVMKGGYVCRRYSTLCNAEELHALGVTADIQSLQLEYDTAITHDQITLEPYPDKIIALREAFNAAITQCL